MQSRAEVGLVLSLGGQRAGWRATRAGEGPRLFDCKDVQNHPSNPLMYNNLYEVPVSRTSCPEQACPAESAGYITLGIAFNMPTGFQQYGSL